MGFHEQTVNYQQANDSGPDPSLDHFLAFR